MGLAWRPVTFSWLGELYLSCPKGSGESSSRFWRVCGFCVSLGSPSGPGSVRNACFLSRFKMALSVHLHCHQPPTCPWNHCLSICSPVPPCTEGQSVLVRSCVDLFLAPQPCLLRHGDLCGLPSALWAHRLRRGAGAHLPRLPEPALCVKGLVGSFSGSPAPLYPVVCVPRRGLYAAPLLAPLGCPPSYRASTASFCSPSPLSGQSHRPWLWSAALSVFCPLSPCSALLSEFL